MKRERVISLLEELLQRPDILIDAIENENTDWTATTLLELAESVLPDETESLPADVEEAAKAFADNYHFGIYSEAKDKAHVRGFIAGYNYALTQYTAKDKEKDELLDKVKDLCLQIKAYSSPSVRPFSDESIRMAVNIDKAAAEIFNSLTKSNTSTEVK